jgi:hypothetical protein
VEGITFLEIMSTDGSGNEGGKQGRMARPGHGLSNYNSIKKRNDLVLMFCGSSAESILKKLVRSGKSLKIPIK